MAVGDGVSAIAQLTVTFGGFSPTAMDGVEASSDQIDRVQAIQAKVKEANRKRRELEFARASEIRTYVDDGDTKWSYVVVDNGVVRVVACETSASKLTIPSELEGKPVYALAAGSCSELDGVAEIVCPESVRSIGSYAFRLCRSLKTLILPPGVSEFHGGWIRACDSLETLVLPGLLERIEADVFECTGIRHLVIGRAVSSVDYGAFQKSALETLEIDPANPFLHTDGDGIYSSDGQTFVALARPCDRYTVAEDVKYLGKKCCYGQSALSQITLPPGLERIGELAFAHSGIRELHVPESVTHVEDKACLHCLDLKAVELRDGLESIGNSAFEQSGLETLWIPASIRHIGNSITARTAIVHSGEDCSLFIDPKSEYLFLDGKGGLYRHEDDGVHMVQLVDRESKVYTVLEGTTKVNDLAFAYHDHIAEVTLPDGVREIGRGAFRICPRLSKVTIADTVERIGEEAFWDTALESFRVPSELRDLGKNALVTYGAHHGDKMPSLHQAEVAPGNDRFFVKDGMLCRRCDGSASVVVFTSSAAHVVFPDEVVSVEDYAFNNARGIDYLQLNERLRTIGTNGLTTWCWIRHIRVLLAEPLEGRTRFDFFFPDTPKSLHGISIGIGGASWVNVPGIMAQLDSCVVSARDYNAPRSSDNIGAYEQVKLVLGRLKDPIMLSKMGRSLYERLVRNYLVEMCVDIARHDDREAIDDLLDMGFLDEGNLEEIIAEVGRLQDAAMTGYLLEVKRRRFNKAAIDFDL